ncbi:hypothetical protein [Streptomyces sp. x-80]|uniref:hypothetical protein n=1 Tax=Streptomyces sp. x-80 TaxID=2789282 RepID=UPI003980E047
MNRLTRAAEENRRAADVARAHGREERARQLEDRADELESGRVRDLTDDVSGLISSLFRR